MTMQFDPVLLAPRMEPMKAQGLWRDETIEVYFQKALRRCPDKDAVVAYLTAATSRSASLTANSTPASIASPDRSPHLASAMATSSPNQLPNWWEFIAL